MRTSNGTAEGALTRRALVRGGAAAAAGLALGAPRLAAARRGAAADLVLRNGRVHTLAGARQQAVAIADGRIAYVGSNAGADALAGAGTEVIDLGGRMVMPGIHDGHMHPLSGGLVLTAPTLNYRQLNLKEFVAAIRKLLARTSEEEPDGWLSVDLWDATAMDKLPTKEDLDKLETSRPIIVFALDGHIALANSRALAIGGVDASTPDPPGGEIRRGPNGEPTGILLDNAIGLVADKVPPLTTEQNARALAAAYAQMAKQGITSYLEASGGEEELAAMALLSDQGALTVRPSVAVYGDSELATDPAALLAHVEQMRATYGRPDVTIGTVKLFFDGVIEYPTQTAALLKPYRVNKGTKRDPKFVPGKSRGPTYFPPRVAKAAIAALDAAGWQVHVHAIGDRAVRSALDAFEHARDVNGPADNRHTITHLELVNPKDFARFAKLGVLASMQLHWAERDSYTVDRLKPYVGTKRWRNTYPAGSLHRAGATLCGGSDWPVDPLLPFRQIEMGVNRTADEVYVGDPEPLFAHEGLKLHESIVMHTRNSAFQLHQEGTSGRIVEGLAADLAVLDRDLLRVPLKRVSKTKVELTLLGGRVVHRGGGLAA